MMQDMANTSDTREQERLRQRVAELEHILAEHEAARRWDDSNTDFFSSMGHDIPRSLLETAPVIALVLDTHGHIVRFNRYLEELCGYTLHEVKGRDWFDCFVPEPEQDRSRELLLQTTHTLQVRGDSSPILTRHDDVYEIEWYAQVMKDVRGVPTGIFAIGIDKTARMQYERERKAIMNVAAALRTAVNRGDMIAILLDQMSALLQTDDVALFLEHPSTGGSMVEQGRGVLAPLTGRVIEAGESGVGPVLAEIQRSLQTHGPAQLCTGRPRSNAAIRTFTCIPLVAHDHALGMLCVGNWRSITNQDIRLLNAIADMAANALHRTTLHEQTRLRLQRIQALHAIDLAITTNCDVYQTFHVVLEQIMSHLRVDTVAVLLFNPVTGFLEYADGQGFRTSRIKRTQVRFGEGLAGRTAQSLRLVHVPDVRQDAECKRLTLIQEEGFVSYYGIPLVVRGQVKGVLEIFHRTPLVLDLEWLDFLHILAGQAVIAIEHAELFAEIQRTNDALVLAYDTTIEGLARALELRDAETAGHSWRVTELTLKLAHAMGCFSGDEMVHIRRGAILHDVGKVAIPDAILLKQGPLTDLEYAVMQMHTTYAHDMLSHIPFLRPALDIPYCHHEKWDGSGYPQGLKGEEIPLAARIFAVVDVYDALSSDRPYRRRWSEQQVHAYLCDQAGTHFDPDVVGIFLHKVLLADGS